MTMKSAHSITIDECDANSPVFIDAFSGCGGITLGLLRSGWMGLFAAEKDKFAFDTFNCNILQGPYGQSFRWPNWLPKKPICVQSLIDEKAQHLQALRGKVVLLAGGPPCQGFSSAGRRDSDDPRNQMMHVYLELATLLQPSMILLENVKGITVDFRQTNNEEEIANYAAYVYEFLEGEYVVYWTMSDASDYGVPQARRRFILIALHKRFSQETDDIEYQIDVARRDFLRRNRMVCPMTAIEAISDLEVKRNGTTTSTENPRFSVIRYIEPRTHYQRLMRDGHEGPPSDLRLARHRPDIQGRFEAIISECNKNGRLNISIGRELREEWGLKKQALRVLDPHRPAPTITSMPDDLLHYSEPRTLTVRENARLQSFPDWFAFKGKYTTGGHLRRLEVPRFTQVANALPPFMAEVFGTALLEIWHKSRQ